MLSRYIEPAVSFPPTGCETQKVGRLASILFQSGDGRKQDESMASALISKEGAQLGESKALRRIGKQLSWWLWWYKES